MVDGKYEADAYTPRPAEEMEVLKAIVMKAVGFNGERGDQMEVANIPFKKVDEAPSVPLDPYAQFNQWVRSPVGMGAIGGGLILLFVLFKLLLRRRPVPQPETPARSESLALEATKPEPDQIEETVQDAVEKIIVASNPHQVQLAQIAQDYPEMTVQLIRGWLHEGKRERAPHS
jgi:flagellar M-ring protein FliF